MTVPDALLPSPTGTQADALGLEAFAAIDRMREALSAQFSGGLSPAALALACLDWSTHLAAAPGKRAELVWKAARKATKLAGHLAACGLGAGNAACIEPLPGDERFAGEAWRHWPYNLWAQSFLLTQQWWHNATREVPG